MLSQRLAGLALASIAVVGLSTAASAQSYSNVTVNATTDIFGAGYGDAPEPGGDYFAGATVPTGYSLTAGTGRVLTFSNVTGEVGAANDLDPSHGPDGYNFGGSVWNINSYRSISGAFATDDTNDLALVGVFTNGTPSGTAPARVDITTQKSLASFAPLLNQTFFIGDGLTGTGSGSIQQFLVPDSATTLSLGFEDAFSFNGDTGYYSDNVGHDTASFKIAGTNAAVPEPGSFALLALGLAPLALIARRRRA